MDEAEPGADGVGIGVAWVNKLRFHVGMGSNGGYTHVSCFFVIYWLVVWNMFYFP